MKESLFNLCNQSLSGCNATGTLIYAIYVIFVQVGHSSRDEMEPGGGFWAGLHSDNFIIISLGAEWILNPTQSNPRCPCLHNTLSTVVCP